MEESWRRQLAASQAALSKAANEQQQVTAQATLSAVQVGWLGL